MHPYDLNPGSDSLRWLQMAEKLLTTRDLIGSKSFAAKALESDPNSEAAEQILAIADTLIAGDKQASSNHLDWYSILQLARRTHDSELIGLQYKRLGVLLNPNRNKYPFAEHAYKLVTEAWLVLSNPSRKFRFDNEFGNSNSTHFNFIQTHFDNTQQQSSRISGGGSGSSGSGAQFDFMQGGSGGMQFVQQQQQVFAPQARPFFGEEQQQQIVESLSNQGHWASQGKQVLVRPQPQQPLVRPHPQQTWFQQPEAQTHVQHPLPQAQPHIQQPSHWAQSRPQSLPQSLAESGEQSTHDRDDKVKYSVQLVRYFDLVSRIHSRMSC
nr:PREDICTED: uncharacterized protein LOC108220218 [Daucus carota subsp. sativus]